MLCSPALNGFLAGPASGTGRADGPPMPWPAFNNLDDSDPKAIFAYLQSIEPVGNWVPEPVLSGDPKMGAYTQMRKLPAATDNPLHTHSSELKSPTSS